MHAVTNSTVGCLIIHIDLPMMTSTAIVTAIPEIIYCHGAANDN